MNLKEWADKLQDYFIDKKEHFTMVIQEEDEVTYGVEEECNIDYCKQHNISCSNRHDGGGTIVHAKGSIGINYIYSHDKYGGFYSYDFIKLLAQYLEDKGLNVSVDKNDILVDGYKVASCAENNIPPDYRWCSTSVLISMTQNVDLINKVCLKTMLKEPKGLEEFGITANEIVEFINSWKGDNIYE